MKNSPQPEGQNPNLNFKAQIAKARQDLHDAEALAYSLEKRHAETLEKIELEAAFLRLLLRLG